MVASARKLIGATNPLQAEPGTIRGDLAVQTGRSDTFRILDFAITCNFFFAGCSDLFYTLHRNYVI